MITDGLRNGFLVTTLLQDVCLHRDVQYPLRKLSSALLKYIGVSPNLTKDNGEHHDY